MCAGHGWPQAMASAAVLLAVTCSVAWADTFQGGWVPLTAPCPTCRNSRDVASEAARPQATDATQFHHPPPPLSTAPAAAFVGQQVQQHFLQQRPDLQQLIGRPASQQILAPPTAQGFLQPSALNLAALLQLQQQQQLQLQQLQQKLQQPLLSMPLDTPPLRSAAQEVQQSATPEVQRSTPRTLQNVTEGEEVQLLYVPVETLRQRVRLQAEQMDRPHQDKREEQQVQRQQQMSPVIRQRPEQQIARTQQRQQVTTAKPTPHTPPLSVFMDNEGRAVRISDVVRVLKVAKMVDVLDTVGPDSPQIFVGPSNLETPEGYTKFELPYLSSIESNRVERRVDKLPFFVAPLSFKPPPGYSKIPFPPPHVGSVVVSSDASILTEKNNSQEKSTEATIATVRGRQPSTYSLPPDLPPINPQLPSLVNSLEDPAQRGKNILLVPQDDQLSTSPPAQISTRPTYIFRQSQRNNFRAQESGQDQRKSQIEQLSSTQPPQETFLVQPKSQFQSQVAVEQEGERIVPSIASVIPQIQFPPQSTKQPASNFLQGQILSSQIATQQGVTSSQEPVPQRTVDKTLKTSQQFQRGRYQQNQFTEQESVSELPSATPQVPAQKIPNQFSPGHFQRGEFQPTQFPTQTTHIPDEVPRRQTHNQNQYTANQLKLSRFQQDSHQQNLVQNVPSGPTQNEQFLSTSNQPQRDRFNHNQHSRENVPPQSRVPTTTAYDQKQNDNTYLTTEKYQRGRLHHNRLSEQTTESTPATENSRLLTLTTAPLDITQSLTATVPAPQPTGQQGTAQAIDSTKFQEYLDQLISNPQSSGPLSQSQEALQKLRELIAQNPQLLSPQNEKTNPVEQETDQQNSRDKQILHQKEATAGFSQNPTSPLLSPVQPSVYTTTTVSTTFGVFRRQPSRGRQRITTSTYAPTTSTTTASRRNYPRNRRPVQTRVRNQEPVTTSTTTTTEAIVEKQNYESQAPLENYPLAYFTQIQQTVPNFGSVGTDDSYQKLPEIGSLVQNSQYEEQTDVPSTISHSGAQQNAYSQPISQLYIPKQQEDLGTTTTTHKPPTSYQPLERGNIQRNHRFRGRQRSQQTTQKPLLPKDETFGANNPSFSSKETQLRSSNSSPQLRNTQEETTVKDVILSHDAQLPQLVPVLSTEVTHPSTATPIQELQQQIQTLQEGHDINKGLQLEFQQQHFEPTDPQQPSPLLQPTVVQAYQETEASSAVEPHQIVTTFQTSELNSVTPKPSEYVQSVDTTENILPIQRNGPRYTNIHRNRQRNQPNVVYQESFVQNQVQNENTDNTRTEEQSQNSFGRFRFGEVSRQLATTPRTTTEETSRPVHAKLRGRSRTRQRIQGNEHISQKNQYSGSTRQEPNQEEETYGFIQTTPKSLFVDNYSEETTEQISVQRIKNTAQSSVRNSESEEGDYSTAVTPSSETSPQHVIRVGLRKKIRGSARRQTTTATPIPTSSTTTENPHKVYTVRPIRRPNVKTKLVNTKGRIRRPTTPTTTPSAATTLPILQATAPEWEQRRPGAQRLPYAGTNEVIAQTARSSLQKYRVKQQPSPQSWSPSPTGSSLSDASDFHINLGDNLNQQAPGSAQWTASQNEGFFINFGQSQDNIPNDQFVVGSQRQPSYMEEQGVAESQRHSTIYMLPYPSEERKETDELVYGFVDTTTIASVLEDTTVLPDEEQKKEDFTTELNTQLLGKELKEEESKTNLKKTADLYSTSKKIVQGRRRGAWIRVRVAPSRQDILETAESQNLATVSFNAISSPPPKATQSVEKYYDGLEGSSNMNNSSAPEVYHLPPQATTYPAITIIPTEPTTIDTVDSFGITTVPTQHNHKPEFNDVSEQEKAAANQTTHFFRALWDMAAYDDSSTSTFWGPDADTAEESSDQINATNWHGEIIGNEEIGTTEQTSIETQHTEGKLSKTNVLDNVTTEVIINAQDRNISNQTSTNRNYTVGTALYDNTAQDDMPKWNDYESQETVKQPENTYSGETTTKFDHILTDSIITRNEEKLPVKFSYKIRVPYKLNNSDIQKPVIKIRDKPQVSNLSTQINTNMSDTVKIKISDLKQSNYNLIATTDSENHRFTNEQANTDVKKLSTHLLLKKAKQKSSTPYSSPIFDTIQDIISKAESYDSNESTQPEINFEIQKMKPRTSTTELPMMEQLRILGTSTSTEVSHETEICYRGRCVKTKTKAYDQVPVE